MEAELRSHIQHRADDLEKLCVLRAESERLGISRLLDNLD